MYIYSLSLEPFVFFLIVSHPPSPPLEQAAWTVAEGRGLPPGFHQDVQGRGLGNAG